MTVRTWPRGPITPIGFPLKTMLIPPALPIRIRPLSCPSRTFFCSVSRIPLKVCLPSVMIESHVGSRAESSTRKPREDWDEARELDDAAEAPELTEAVSESSAPELWRPPDLKPAGTQLTTDSNRSALEFSQKA